MATGVIGAPAFPIQGEPTVPPHVYRFTVEQFHRIVDSGVFTKDRVELLEGWIVQKMTQYPPHATAIDATLEALRPLLPAGWRLREQKPISTLESEPEPDVIVVRGPVRRYAQRHPEPGDIALVIEVADTTLEEDRGRKGRIYARARIPVYWIINLVEAKVEVYTQPRAGRKPAYREHRDYGIDESVPLTIAGHEPGSAAVRDLLP
jgi:Uma2 family endonuclease